MGRKKRRLRKKEVQRMRARERGFVIATKEKLPEYNPLHDRNLRHYFESRRVQKLLHRGGMIDREGRVIDLERNKSKLFIIEQEFKNAERAEEERAREEEVLRQQVHTKRLRALEEKMVKSRLQKIKEDRMLRREILRVQAASLSMSSPLSSSSVADSPLLASLERKRTERRAKKKRGDAETLGVTRMAMAGSASLTSLGGDDLSYAGTDVDATELYGMGDEEFM
eukprot:PLAT14611.1.p1 GENE.PLAT14611.1~~PLAT14611.1.p1  ORF type:complete len:225 (+),score=88.95 PLAT14611.1:41-715(+)